MSSPIPSPEIPVHSAVVLLGPPSAGRSRLSAPLAARLGLRHVSARSLLEAAAHEPGPTSHLLRFYVEAGAAVPAALALSQLSPQLAPDGAMVLEGLPQSLEQAEALDHWLQRRGAAPALAVRLDLHENAVMLRLSGRRHCLRCPEMDYNLFLKPPVIEWRCDRCGAPLRQHIRDEPEMVLRRLRRRSDQERPIERHYRQAGRLLRVDADAGPQGVLDRLDSLLRRRPALRAA